MTNRLQSLYDNARTRTFEHDGAKITVRETLGIDKMDMPVYRGYIHDSIVKHRSEKLLAKNPKSRETVEVSGTEWRRILSYVAFVIRTVNIKGKVWTKEEKPRLLKIPDRHSTEDVWIELFDDFCCLSFDFLELWDDELVAVNKPEPDPEVLPGDESSTTNT